MRGLFAIATVVGIAIGCGGGGTNPGDPDAAGPTPDAFAGSDIGPTGNPDGACTAGVPARGQLVDTSQPTAVVGDGTPASCTAAALRTAVAGGGIITFACGDGVATIAIDATIAVPIDRDTTIDGGRKVILDGGGAVQILRMDSPDFRASDFVLTVQNLALLNAKTTPTEMIPPAPAPCSQGFNDGEGGAIYIRDGNLDVIDSLFRNDRAAPLGPDTGGGAIYVLGSKTGVVIAGSTFEDDAASNAAAVGGLFAELDIYDSLFQNNTALGNGANNNDMTMCTAMNNGQYEVGSGGNGGAIYSDGASVDVTLCGDKIVDNHAGDGAFGGGLFFTSNDFGGDLSIIDTTMAGNTGGSWTVVATGATDYAGTAVGTNTHSLTIVNSDLQGL